MLSWSQKRRAAVLSLVGFFMLIVIGVPVLIALRDKPSCQNRTKDDGERGVDCGGACRLLCADQVLLPQVSFVRPVQVEEGLWGAVASLENRNLAAAIAPYVIKLYDANNLLLFERHGRAYVPPRKVFAIFEGRMSTGGRIPARATFEFEGPLQLYTLQEEIVLDVRNKRLEKQDGVTRLEADLWNPTLQDQGKVHLTALLFDDKGNVFAASATNLDRLSGQSKASIAFTWPYAFTVQPARIEILYTFPL